MDIRFERGIEHISHSSQGSPMLPDTALLPPSDTATTPELDRLLARPNLRDYVSAALRPAISDKALLTPSGFQQALYDAITLLRQQAATAEPMHAAVLEGGLRELGTQTELRELLALYRNALYQG